MDRLRRTALDDDDPERRCLALVLIGHTGRLRDVDVLALGLLARDQAVVAHAKAALNRHLPRFAQANGAEELEELPMLSLRVAAGRADVEARIAAVHIIRRHVDALAVLGQLLDAIRDPAPDVRVGAAHGLAVFGQAESVAALLQATLDEDSRVVEAAVVALGELGVSKAVPRLVELLARGPTRLLLEALRKIGDVSAVEPVIELLRSDDAEIRRAAAMALANLRTVASVSALTTALKDPSAGVRSAALMALGELEARTLISLVIPLLDDPDLSVRRAAVVALERFSDRTAIPALDDVRRDDPEAGVRFAAARALAALGADDAFAALTDTAATVRERRGASRAKADLPSWSDEVVEQLDAALRSGDTRRCLDALWAVGERAFVDAAPRIVPLLTARNPALQRAAAWALGRMRYRQALPSLREMYEHADATVRKDVAWALGECLDHAAVPTLSRMVYDADDDVSAAALNALATLRATSAADLVAAVARDSLEPKRRRAATNALGTLRCDVAYDTLVLKLHDDSPAIRRAAASALSKQGNVAAASVLTATAAEDADPTVREAATVALAELVGGDALGALVLRLADSESRVRAAAIAALQKVPYDDAALHLAAACDDPAPEVRAAAARTIGLFGRAELLGALESLLLDEYHLVEREAIAALGRVARDRVHEGVAAATQSSDSRLRSAAARALAWIRDPEARAMLRSLTEDEDPTVRRQADDLLRRHWRRGRS